MEKSFAIDEKAYGFDHPSTRIRASTVAGLYEKVGKYAESEALYNRILRSKRVLDEPSHKIQIHTLERLAHVYDKDGKHEEATTCRARAAELQAELKK